MNNKLNKSECHLLKEQVIQDGQLTTYMGRAYPYIIEYMVE